MRHTKKSAAASLVLLSLGLAGCPVNNPSLEGDGSEAARTSVKNFINDQLIQLNDASLALQAAAPEADADGWNATDDAAAVAAMRSEWKKARIAYENVEGAIAVLFPGLDAATDERYDGFFEAADFEDANLFDGEGVTGVHAVERVLFSDDIDATVLTFEQGVAGARYVAPAFPATEAEARDFKTSLTQRLIDDTATMRDEFAGVDLALEAAYRGVLGSMQEQFEKVDLAGQGADESRYARHTVADMRANLAGGLAVFEAFDAMFDAVGSEDAEATHDAIHEAFERVEVVYDGIDGDGIPAVPATWNPDAPSADDAAGAYGTLYLFLAHETDFEKDDSFVSVFRDGADVLGIPELAE